MSDLDNDPTFNSFLTKKIQKTSSFKPTEDQKIAIEKITKFLDNYNESNIFVLKGYAGTGKTTLVNDTLYSYYRRGKKIAVTAFTNKATNVISKKTPFADGISLYKLLGLKSDEDSEKLVFDAKGKDKVEDYNIIVLDEVSMVHDQNFELFNRKLKYSRAKAIVMGDPAQLPPVEQETDSIAFNVQPQYELTEIIRQGKNSGIPVYSKYVRKILDEINKGNIINVKTQIPTNPNHEDVKIFNESKSFIELMIEDFQSPQYRENSDYVKVIAYRNNTIDKINFIIRKNIFGDNSEPINIGENMLLNSPVIDTETGFNIYDTSDEIEIIRILDFQEYNETKNGVNLKFPFYYAETKRKFDGKITKMCIVNPNYKKTFTESVSNWGKAISKIGGWDAKSIFKLEFYPFKKEFHTPSYNYAITSHKSQGSTYEKVYVVEDDIEQVSQANTKSLWQSKYVAYTRPSKELIILNRITDRKMLDELE